ncbi:hypothetical protein DPMN_073898 [Dreissena polymorpha]|uniref:Uncharacterized protein n=1 Tax=Dreissena polymorpha TaxID=45954 RepID=A0A9D3YEC3_DREPO|nr:hypothetical protein DPMN_073898 [Dreissena polymorpha]
MIPDKINSGRGGHKAAGRMQRFMAHQKGRNLNFCCCRKKCCSSSIKMLLEQQITARAACRCCSGSNLLLEQHFFCCSRKILLDQHLFLDYGISQSESDYT